MSRPRTTPIGAALVITFVCFLLQPTPSAAAQDGGMLQGLWARAEAILRIFVAPHPAASSPSEEPATWKANRKERQSEIDREAAPPPSRYLMDMNTDGEAAPPPSRYLIDMNTDGEAAPPPSRHLIHADADG